MTEEVASLVRTRESYDVDLKLRDPKSTGIYKECVFNKLSDFHITENQAADIMHDIFEAIANYTIGNVLHSLIYDEKSYSL